MPKFRPLSAPYYEIAERWLIHERTVISIAKRYRVSRGPFPFSAKRDQELRDAILNNQNLSFLALARKLGVSYTSIFKRAESHGDQDALLVNAREVVRSTAKQRKQFLTLCRSSHATYREIGKIFGFKANLVKKYALRNGINRRGGSERVIGHGDDRWSYVRRASPLALPCLSSCLQGECCSRY